ncbi:hypothetical protein CPC08DRAFT_770556 [Agrocybe pediades]|nr:hypothetical protein CPC08DRAFT_770556 [Agrocybe pediades]
MARLLQSEDEKSGDLTSYKVWMTSPDQCTIDQDGNLKDARDIHFQYSESEDVPMAAVGSTAECRQSSRTTTNNLKQILDTEKRNANGNLEKAFRMRQDERQPPQRKAKKIKKVKATKSTASHDGDDDDDDVDFINDVISLSGDSEDLSDDDDPDSMITNAELAAALPSKSIPATGRRSGKRKRAAATSPSSDIEDAIQPDTSALAKKTQTLASEPLAKKAKETTKKNPRHYFFEQVTTGADGTVGDTGDRAVTRTVLRYGP